MSDLARRLLTLFMGSEEAHGTYSADGGTNTVGGKIEIKSSARTLREPATEEYWDLHLKGERPLGIIPLLQNGTIWWACGDVDRYDIDHGELARKIEGYKLPLLVTKSKSGGAHVFLWLEGPAQADAAQKWFQFHMARLGYGGCEVFPKQTKILRERGDLGNWIVMPYFGDTQWAVRPGGGEYTALEFVRKAEELRVPPSFLELPKVGKKNGHANGHTSPLLSDGPPCLEHLVTAGFPEGTRNKGLFAIGVYCRKRWPGEWQAKLEEFNQLSMKPPLPSEEVAGVVRSLERKDYSYTCSDVPLVSHCNKPLCITRLHGIGSGGGIMPTISGLAVLESEPPIWFVDIEETRLELSTDELLNFRLFQKVVAEKLYQVVRSLKQEQWLRMVADAMESVSRIEVSPDAGSHGQFMEVLVEFLTNRARGLKKEDMFSKRPWWDQEGGRYYFRLMDVDRLLKRATIEITRGEIIAHVRRLGGGKHFFNIKGRALNTWWVPEAAVTPPPQGEVPEIRPEVF